MNEAVAHRQTLAQLLYQQQRQAAQAPAAQPPPQNDDVVVQKNNSWQIKWQLFRYQHHNRSTKRLWTPSGPTATPPPHTTRRNWMR